MDSVFFPEHEQVHKTNEIYDQLTFSYDRFPGNIGQKETGICHSSSFMHLQISPGTATLRLRQS